MTQKRKTTLSVAAAMGTLAFTATSANAAVTILATNFNTVGISLSTATGITWDTVNGIDTPSTSMVFIRDAAGDVLRGDVNSRINVNTKLSSEELTAGRGSWSSSIDFQVSASTSTIDLTNFSVVWEALNSGGTANSPSKTTQWTVEVFNRSGAALGSSLGSKTVDDTWTGGTKTLDINNLSASLGQLNGGSEYRLTFTASGPSSPGHFVAFDDLSISGDITAIPEPATTALLGLGGLALILRRRK